MVSYIKPFTKILKFLAIWVKGPVALRDGRRVEAAVVGQGGHDDQHGEGSPPVVGNM